MSHYGFWFGLYSYSSLDILHSWIYYMSSGHIGIFRNYIICAMELEKKKWLQKEINRLCVDKVNVNDFIKSIITESTPGINEKLELIKVQLPVKLVGVNKWIKTIFDYYVDDSWYADFLVDREDHMYTDEDLIKTTSDDFLCYFNDWVGYLLDDIIHW